MCEAPPLSQIRIVDFACLREAGAAEPGRFNPQKVSPLAARKTRRDTAERVISWPVCMRVALVQARISWMIRAGRPSVLTAQSGWRRPCPQRLQDRYGPSAGIALDNLDPRTIHENARRSVDFLHPTGGARAANHYGPPVPGPGNARTSSRTLRTIISSMAGDQPAGCP